VSVAKAEKLRALCAAMLALRTVSLRNLQRVGGLLAFLATAATDATFCRRGINLATAEAERLPGRTVGVKGLLHDDLRFWLREAVHLPNRTPVVVGAVATSICTDAAGAPLRGFGAVVWPGTAVTPDIDLALNDRVDRTGDRFLALFGPLLQMTAESSTALETEALRLTIRRLLRLRPAWVVGRTIHWYSDSQSAVAALCRWRARSTGLLQVMHNLFVLLRRHNIVVVPHWVSRALQWMPVADWLSRLWWRRAAAEWSIPQHVVIEVVRWAGWQPVIDLFAVAGNQQFVDFATRFPTPGARCNAFAAPWVGLRAWAFPPFSQLTQVWRHWAGATDSRLLLVLPATTSVPEGVQVFGSYPLPHVPLVGPRGDTAADPFFTALVVYDLRNGIT
jgi:hypothetical protein